MSKKGGSAPATPDPNQVSQAQTQSNEQTALYNFGLNNPSVITPMGSSTFSVANAGPQYDTNAYNAALQAWQNAGSPSGSNIPAGLNKQMFLQQYDPSGYQNALTNGMTPAQQQAWQSYQSGNVSAGKGGMPTLDQFKTGDGGNPQSTQTIQLSPQQQQLYDQQTQQSLALSNLANQLQGNVGASLSQPTPTTSDINALSKQAQDAYYNQEASYLDPQYAAQKNQLDSKLANQGIMPGSDAYNLAMDQYNRDKTFAYNQAQQNAITSGPQNAQQLFGLSTAVRDQPLNEFNALRTGSQPQMPQFNSVNTSAVSPTNVAQNIWNAYGGQTNAYNQQQAASNANTQGLFGLGSALLGGGGGGLFSNGISSLLSFL